MFQVIFLLLFPLLSKGEVSLFANCRQFFLNGISPTILTDIFNNNRYKQICQCLLDQNNKPEYFYATLYDTVNKIPVYSAYVFKHPPEARKEKWLIEPQLDGLNDRCMRTKNNRRIGGNQIGGHKIGEHQALDEDYDLSGYDKGHLYPVSHTKTYRAMEATFTLTNAAPQNSSFNRGQWMKHEKALVDTLKSCSKAYVVTGVIPGNQLIKDRVKVAEKYWTAYCCLNNGNRHSGFIGPDQNGKVQNLTVTDLETTLKRRYNDTTFTVFSGRC